MKTILIIDDQLAVRTLIREYLTAEGFRVCEAEDGRKGLLVARLERPDLILLDIMMPEMTGFEFIRHLRREATTPVILLTAKQEESEKVIGLELGADDYLTKPFGMRELVARIRAVLRRLDPPSVETILQSGDLTLDRHRHEVREGQRLINLTPTEFDLLAILMAEPGRVFGRAQLLDAVIGDGAERVERTIDVHIRNLRVKLETGGQVYIETVFGVGYRFRSGQ